MNHYDIKIFGNVQGVFFRHSAKELAEKLGLRGFARNESNGAVYIEIEGNQAAVEKFIGWVKKGPPSARVENAKIQKGEVKNFKDFRVE